MLCEAQINGYYEGNFLKRNLFKVVQNDTIVSGEIYSSKFESYSFNGFYSKGILRGYFLISNKSKVIAGKFYLDTLKFNEISDSVVNKTWTFILLTRKSNYSLDKFFKDQKTERDIRLIGRWRLVKKTDLKGTNQAIEYSITEFLKSGTIIEDSQTMDKIKRVASQNGVKIPEFTWETIADKLILKAQVNIPNFSGLTERVDSFYFSGDTLVQIEPTFKRFLLKAKKSKDNSKK